MTLVNVNCTDQTLTVTSRPQIASGGVNEDRMEFSFCAKWDGYTKTAVFYREADKVYHVLLDENDTCIIPREVLLEPGLLHFGVFGVNGDTVRTSAVQVYSVAEGAITEATAVPDPTPDIYAQLLARIGDLSKLETADRSSLVAAINEVKRTGGGSGGVSFTTDETLSLKDGVLGVNTADAAEKDNTLPITSAAVHTAVGNIEILLATI